MNFKDDNLNEKRERCFIWIQWLIAGAVFSLIFDNIPKFLQLNFISGSFASKFTWYFLFILSIVWGYQICKGIFTIEKKDYQYMKYIMLLLIIILFSNIWGLICYPYYSDLFSGPNSQIEKLPFIFNLLNSNGISLNIENLTMLWIGGRAIKSSLLGILYTFGFSFVLYQFFKRDWGYYFELITKVVIVSVTFLCLYSVIELFYFANFDFAKNLLSIINPMIHPIAIDHGWWPPLLWDGQLRSMFSEPSRMGNYLAFALPFLWGKFLLIDKNIGLSILLLFYTFMIFLTQARTAITMYFGVLFLLFLGIMFIHKRVLIKKFLILCAITVFSLGISIAFINMTGQEVTVTSYMENNVSSLTDNAKRSNGARYALIRANVQTGLNHPILGVGDILGATYTVYNFSETDLANDEVHMWVTDYHKEGPLRNNLDAMNEYVTRFANNGILGLIIFILPLAYVLRKLFFSFRSVKENQKIKVMTVLVSLVGSAVAGCNGSLTLLYTYWVILAFSYAIINGICKEK